VHTDLYLKTVTVTITAQGAYNSGKPEMENLEISGNLLILENSGSLKFTRGIYQMLAVFL